MRALRVPLVLGVLLVAGCSDPEEARAPPDTLPVDWDEGVPLEAYQMGGYHNGGQDADLYPSEGLGRPVSCKAFRGDESVAVDRCAVEDATYDWEDGATWVLRAHWAGRGEQPSAWNDRTYEARVVAYSRSGDAVAWWDSQPGPETVFYTE